MFYGKCARIPQPAREIIVQTELSHAAYLEGYTFYE